MTFDWTQPCVIPLQKQWKLQDEWFNEQGNINIEYLKETYGKLSVDVANCDIRDFTDMEKSTMKFCDFLSELESQISKILYLKDWHLCRNTGNYSLYETPIPFNDDWLNKWADATGRDDFRFVYFGTDKSWTPLHADVFRSFSWSTNVCGIKEWIFFPPDQERFLGNDYSLVYDVTAVNESIYKGFKQAKPIKIIQFPGETIFVPSNWFHQVHNHGITLSVNHNFINSKNIVSCTAHFLKCLNEVRRSLSDLLDPPVSLKREEYEWECQRLQKDHYGMDVCDMHDFLSFIHHQLAKTREDHLYLNKALEILYSDLFIAKYFDEHSIKT